MGQEPEGRCCRRARPPRMAHTAFLSHRALLLLRARRPRGGMAHCVHSVQHDAQRRACLFSELRRGPCQRGHYCGARGGSVSEASIPSAYRYAHVAHDGTVLATDLSAERLRRALDATASFRSEGASNPQTFGIDGTTYSVGKLADGTFCILTSTYMPGIHHTRAARRTS